MKCLFPKCANGCVGHNAVNSPVLKLQLSQTQGEPVKAGRYMAENTGERKWPYDSYRIQEYFY